MVKGFDKDAFVEIHKSGEQVTSIRVNPKKISAAQSLSLRKQEAVPWSSHGYYLVDRPSFTSDPLFHAGAYYVQEASSMFLEEVMKQSCDLTKPLRVLDLCAAPGGKSILIQSLITADSLLVSNEVIKARVNILTENIIKWGAANVVVTNNDPKDFERLAFFFDVIVVDAPCSGSGLFRKDEDAITEWSTNNVALCSQRQQRILADCLPSLKPGGMLIYSTCSYSVEEDETIADWLTTDHNMSSFKMKIKNEWNIVETRSAKKSAYGYRFYPDKLKGEGFFIAAFKKEETSFNADEIKIKNKPAFADKKEMAILNTMINHAGNFSFLKWQEEILAIPALLLQDVLVLQSIFYLKKAGVKIGTIIRNELIPDHEFALANISSKFVPAIEVDNEMALQYLRRAELILKTDLKGWALICYRGLPLGWIKILSNRINNYYPKDWRILNR